MKAKMVLLILMTALLAGTGSSAGRSFRSESQAELNADAARELRVAEAQMEELLRTLNSKAEGHTEALAKLNRAQGAWATYREAYPESLWPSNDTLRSYGTVHPMCLRMERTRLTMQRIEELRVMLKAEERLCSLTWPE